MSKVLQALPPPEQSQASQALPTACPPTVRCRRLPPTVVALYNWAGLCQVRRVPDGVVCGGPGRSGPDGKPKYHAFE